MIFVELFVGVMMGAVLTAAGFQLGRRAEMQATNESREAAPAKVVDCICTHRINAHRGPDFTGSCGVAGSKPNTECYCQGYVAKV